MCYNLCTLYALHYLYIHIKILFILQQSNCITQIVNHEIIKPHSSIQKTTCDYNINVKIELMSTFKTQSQRYLVLHNSKETETWTSVNMKRADVQTTVVQYSETSMEFNQRMVQRFFIIGLYLCSYTYCYSYSYIFLGLLDRFLVRNGLLCRL